MSDGTDQDAAFEALLGYLRDVRAFDFTGYKRTTLRRRVNKRLQDVGIESFEECRDFLEAHPEEFTSLFNTILINVTRFFRNPPAREHLQQEVVPQLPALRHPYTPVRVWSAGCASGEEAYTLAIVMAEVLGPEAFRQRVKIYATDVDEEALTQARHGAYAAQHSRRSHPPCGTATSRRTTTASPCGRNCAAR